MHSTVPAANFLLLCTQNPVKGEDLMLTSLNHTEEKGRVGAWRNWVRSQILRVRVFSKVITCRIRNQSG